VDKLCIGIRFVLCMLVNRQVMLNILHVCIKFSFIMFSDWDIHDIYQQKLKLN